MALAAVLATAGDGLGQPPTAKERTDAGSVSLPDGVVTRLGSDRFRFEAKVGGPLVFSPDGKLLAYGPSVFDVATGRRVHLLPTAGSQGSWVVRFLDDGKRVAVAVQGGGRLGLSVYALGEAKPPPALPLPYKPGTSLVDVTPDGSRALLVDNLEKAYLWDVKGGREVWSCGKPSIMDVLPLSPDGKTFVMFDDGFHLRDAATGKSIGKFPRWRWDTTTRCQFPDGRLALANDRNRQIAVLTAGNGGTIRTFASEGSPARFTCSPDGRYLVGTGTYGSQVWDTTAAEGAGPVARLAPAEQAGFSPDGKILAMRDIGYVALYSVGDWKLLPQSADPPSPVIRLRVTDDGKRVFGLTGDGWSNWPVHGGPATVLRDDGLAGLRVRGYWGLGALAELSADGRVAVDLVRPPTKDRSDRRVVLSVVDAAGGKPLALPLEYAPNRPLSLSPDGRYVSASAFGGETRVWDSRTGEVLFRQKRANDERVMAVRPAPDGRSLGRSVVATWPGNDTNGPSYTQVVVYDHVAGTSWKMNPMPWVLYDGVRFSRDGTRIFGRGRYDNVSAKDTVSVWDVRSGRRLVAWTGAYGWDSHDLSADNRSLLVGDGDGRLTLVEVATGAERAHFDHRSTILSTAFLPDGSRAVASSPEAPVYVWDLVGKPGGWDAAKVDAVWADLASLDAKVAYAAVRRLRANPGEAVPFLKARVQPPAVPADAKVAQWLKDLDAPRFAAREQAQKELAAAVDLIRPTVEAAKKGATFEAGRRIDEILKAADGWTPDQLRQLRACEVLEGVRTPDAIRVLKAWAAGPPGARLTVEAKASADRLAP
jgi:WD40 repeat protein